MMSSIGSQCPQQGEESSLRSAAGKCLANQKKLIHHVKHSDIKRGIHLDVIFQDFINVSDIWENGVEKWMSNPSFQLDDFLPKFEEVIYGNYCEKAECWRCPTSVRSHVFVVIFTALLNLKSLEIESDKWEKPGNGLKELTLATEAAFMRIILQIRLNVTCVAKLNREVDNYFWRIENLSKKRGFREDPQLKAYHKRSQEDVFLLLDNFLAVLLKDLVLGMDDGLRGADRGLETSGRICKDTLKNCSQDWEGDLEIVRISSCLLHLIQKNCSSEGPLFTEDECQKIVDHFTELMKCREKGCFHLTRALKEIVDCLRNLIPEDLKSLIKQEEMKLVSESRAWLSNHLKNEDKLKDSLREVFRRRCGIRMLIPASARCIVSLLFDLEFDALETIAEESYDEILTNLDRVAHPMFELDLPQNEIPSPMGVPYRNYIMQKTIDAVAMASHDFKISIFLDFKMIFALLASQMFIADVFTDIAVAVKHFQREDFLFCSLTILFILGPFLAEISNKIWCNCIARNEQLTWREVLFPESIALATRSNSTVRYAQVAQMKFPRYMEVFYCEILYQRLKKYYEELRPMWMCRGNIMEVMLHSRMVQNEIYSSEWKLMECLNESAPQLLLQLYFVLEESIGSENLDTSLGGMTGLFGIIIGSVTLSYTFHLYHYNMHYKGMENDISWPKRILESIMYFFIFFSRSLAISLLLYLDPYICLGVIASYLLVLHLYHLFVSERRLIYRRLLNNRRMLFLPVYRLYVTPSLLKLWKLEKKEEVLFHSETIVMAVLWSILCHPMPSLEVLRWILPSVIVSIALLHILFILGVLRRWCGQTTIYTCHHGYVMKNDVLQMESKSC